MTIVSENLRQLVTLSDNQTSKTNSSRSKLSYIVCSAIVNSVTFHIIEDPHSYPLLTLFHFLVSSTQPHSINEISVGNGMTVVRSGIRQRRFIGPNRILTSGIAKVCCSRMHALKVAF